MNSCSNCFWSDRCDGLTTVKCICDHYTPFEADEDTAREEYLETVRADLTLYARTIPDSNEFGSVHHKSRITAQCLYL